MPLNFDQAKQIVNQANSSNNNASYSGSGSSTFNQMLQNIKANTDAQQQVQQAQTVNDKNVLTDSNSHEITGIEKGIADLAKWGEDIMKIGGFEDAYAEKAQKAKDENRDMNLGDYASLVPSFAASMIPMMVGGLAQDPARLVEAGTGDNLIDGYENGRISNQKLTDEQKLADVAYVGGDLLSFVPAFAAGKAVNAGAKAVSNFEKGASAATKAASAAEKVGTEAVEATAKTAAKEGAKDTEKAFLTKFAEDRKVAAPVLSSMAEEAFAEGAQELPEEVRGDLNQYGLDSIDWDALPGNIAESAGWGALGGAMFGGVAAGGSYLKRTSDKATNKANEDASIKADAGKEESETSPLQSVYAPLHVERDRSGMTNESVYSDYLEEQENKSGKDIRSGSVTQTVGSDLAGQDTRITPDIITDKWSNAGFQDSLQSAWELSDEQMDRLRKAKDQDKNDPNGAIFAKTANEIIAENLEEDNYRTHDLWWVKLPNHVHTGGQTANVVGFIPGRKMAEMSDALAKTGLSDFDTDASIFSTDEKRIYATNKNRKYLAKQIFDRDKNKSNIDDIKAFYNLSHSADDFTNEEYSKFSEDAKKRLASIPEDSSIRKDAEDKLGMLYQAMLKAAPDTYLTDEGLYKEYDYRSHHADNKWEEEAGNDFIAWCMQKMQQIASDAVESYYDKEVLPNIKDEDEKTKEVSKKYKASRYAGEIATHSVKKAMAEHTYDMTHSPEDEADKNVSELNKLVNRSVSAVHDIISGNTRNQDALKIQDRINAVGTLTEDGYNSIFRNVAEAVWYRLKHSEIEWTPTDSSNVYMVALARMTNQDVPGYDAAELSKSVLCQIALLKTLDKTEPFNGDVSKSDFKSKYAEWQEKLLKTFTEEYNKAVKDYNKAAKKKIEQIEENRVLTDSEISQFKLQEMTEDEALFKFSEVLGNSDLKIHDLFSENISSKLTGSAQLDSFGINRDTPFSSILTPGAMSIAFKESTRDILGKGNIFNLYEVTEAREAKKIVDYIKSIFKTLQEEYGIDFESMSKKYRELLRNLQELNEREDNTLQTRFDKAKIILEMNAICKKFNVAIFALSKITGSEILVNYNIHYTEQILRQEDWSNNSPVLASFSNETSFCKFIASAKFLTSFDEINTLISELRNEDISQPEVIANIQRRAILIREYSPIHRMFANRIVTVCSRYAEADENFSESELNKIIKDLESEKKRIENLASPKNATVDLSDFFSASENITDFEGVELTDDLIMAYMMAGPSGEIDLSATSKYKEATAIIQANKFDLTSKRNAVLTELKKLESSSEKVDPYVLRNALEFARLNAESLYDENALRNVLLSVEEITHNDASKGNSGEEGTAYYASTLASYSETPSQAPDMLTQQAEKRYMELSEFVKDPASMIRLLIDSKFEVDLHYIGTDNRSHIIPNLNRQNFLKSFGIELSDSENITLSQLITICELWPPMLDCFGGTELVYSEDFSGNITPQIISSEKRSLPNLIRLSVNEDTEENGLTVQQNTRLKFLRKRIKRELCNNNKVILYLANVAFHKSGNSKDPRILIRAFNEALEAAATICLHSLRTKNLNYQKSYLDVSKEQAALEMVKKALILMQNVNLDNSSTDGLEDLRRRFAEAAETVTDSTLASVGRLYAQRSEMDVSNSAIDSNIDISSIEGLNFSTIDIASRYIESLVRCSHAVRSILSGLESYLGEANDIQQPISYDRARAVVIRDVLGLDENSITQEQNDDIDRITKFLINFYSSSKVSDAFVFQLYSGETTDLDREIGNEVISNLQTTLANNGYAINIEQEQANQCLELYNDMYDAMDGILSLMSSEDDVKAIMDSGTLEEDAIDREVKKASETLAIDVFDYDALLKIRKLTDTLNAANIATQTGVQGTMPLTYSTASLNQDACVKDSALDVATRRPKQTTGKLNFEDGKLIVSETSSGKKIDINESRYYVSYETEDGKKIERRDAVGKNIEVTATYHKKYKNPYSDLISSAIEAMQLKRRKALRAFSRIVSRYMNEVEERKGSFSRMDTNSDICNDILDGLDAIREDIHTSIENTLDREGVVNDVAEQINGAIDLDQAQINWLERDATPFIRCTFKNYSTGDERVILLSDAQLMQLREGNVVSLGIEGLDNNYKISEYVIKPISTSFVNNRFNIMADDAIVEFTKNSGKKPNTEELNKLLDDVYFKCMTDFSDVVLDNASDSNTVGEILNNVSYFNSSYISAARPLPDQQTIVNKFLGLDPTDNSKSDVSTHIDEFNNIEPKRIVDKKKGGPTESRIVVSSESQYIKDNRGDQESNKTERVTHYSNGMTSTENNSVVSTNYNQKTLPDTVESNTVIYIIGDEVREDVIDEAIKTAYELEKYEKGGSQRILPSGRRLVCDEKAKPKVEERLSHFFGHVNSNRTDAIEISDDLNLISGRKFTEYTDLRSSKTLAPRFRGIATPSYECGRKVSPRSLIVGNDRYNSKGEYIESFTFSGDSHALLSGRFFEKRRINLFDRKYKTSIPKFSDGLRIIYPDQVKTFEKENCKNGQRLSDLLYPGFKKNDGKTTVDKLDPNVINSDLEVYKNNANKEYVSSKGIICLLEVKVGQQTYIYPIYHEEGKLPSFIKTKKVYKNRFTNTLTIEYDCQISDETDANRHAKANLPGWASKTFAKFSNWIMTGPFGVYADMTLDKASIEKRKKGESKEQCNKVLMYTLFMEKNDSNGIGRNILEEYFNKNNFLHLDITEEEREALTTLNFKSNIWKKIANGRDIAFHKPMNRILRTIACACEGSNYHPAYFFNNKDEDGMICPIELGMLLNNISLDDLCWLYHEIDENFCPPSSSQTWAKVDRYNQAKYEVYPDGYVKMHGSSKYDSYYTEAYVDIITFTDPDTALESKVSSAKTLGKAVVLKEVEHLGRGANNDDIINAIHFSARNVRRTPSEDIFKRYEDDDSSSNEAQSKTIYSSISGRPIKLSAPKVDKINLSEDEELISPFISSFKDYLSNLYYKRFKERFEPFKKSRTINPRLLVYSERENEYLEDSFINTKIEEINQILNLRDNEKEYELTYSDYVNLIKSITGTSVFVNVREDQKGNEILSNDVYLNAHEHIVESLKAGENPLTFSTEKYKQNLNKGKASFGVVEDNILIKIYNFLKKKNGLDISFEEYRDQQVEKAIELHGDYIKEENGKTFISQSQKEGWNFGYVCMMHLIKEASINDIKWVGRLFSFQSLNDAVEQYVKMYPEADTSEITRYKELFQESRYLFNAYNNYNSEISGQYTIDSDNNSVVIKEEKSQDNVQKAFKAAINLEMGMSLANVPVAAQNLIEKGIIGRLMILGLRWADDGAGRLGFLSKLSPYKKAKIEGHEALSDEDINALKRDPSLTKTLDVFQEAQRGNYIHDLLGVVDRGGDLSQAIEEFQRLNNTTGIKWYDKTIGKVFPVVAKFGTMSDSFKKDRNEIFLRRFYTLVTDAGITEIDGIDIKERLIRDPGGFILSCLHEGNALFPYIFKAYSLSSRPDMMHELMVTVFWDEISKNHQGLKWLQVTYGCRFFKATMGLFERVAHCFLPISTMRHFIIFGMVNNGLGDKVRKSPLGKLTGLDNDNTWNYILARLQAEVDYVADTKEAMAIDLGHMAAPAIAAIMVGYACLEPPDDDDLICNYQEWTFCGIRIAENWWLSDLLGIWLPYACMWSGQMKGIDNASSVFNKGMIQAIESNPIIKVGDALSVVLDPDDALESYEQTIEWYSDYPGGAPEGMEYVLGSFGALCFNTLGQHITPGILKEINRTNSLYEVSYNRVYQENLTGGLTEDAEDYGATQKTTFADAQVRKITRNNPVLGAIMDLFNPGSSTGYQRDEMPRQYIMDETQQSVRQALSVKDEDGNMRSDEEVTSLCGQIVQVLAETDDMDALYHQGFLLDYDTKYKVTEFLSDARQEAKTEYTTTKSLYGYSDEAYQAYQEYYNWISDIYNKLWSDELNQGAVYYNRYNTTYNTDANGNVYATGYREGLGGMLSPILTAPQETGKATSYATASEVTGEAMFDDNGLPMRALIPYVKEDEYDKPTLDSVSSTTTGYSNSYSTWSSSGSSYKRSSGGGGYSRSSGSSYSRRATNPGTISQQDANITYKSHGSKQYGYDTSNPTRTYEANLDYLRPDFESKGSRQAYRRSDF